jgi:hypothetical protein
MKQPSLLEAPSRTIEVALGREAALSSMTIGIGLTQIRRYDFTAAGMFYSGLYSFVTGLERILKLIFIYDHRLANGGAFPTNDVLKKKISHNLKSLIETALEINQRRALGVDDTFLTQDPLGLVIVNLLTDFAFQARYYNLDTMTGAVPVGIEPLARWEREVNREILTRHHKPKRGRTEELALIAHSLAQFSFIKHTADDGSEISTASEFVALGDRVSVKQKYSMYYLYLVSRFAAEVLRELEFQGNAFPALHEYFAVFTNSDKRYILGRKSWNPAPPYRF